MFLYLKAMYSYYYHVIVALGEAYQDERSILSSSMEKWDISPGKHYKGNLDDQIWSEHCNGVFFPQYSSLIYPTEVCCTHMLEGL